MPLKNLKINDRVIVCLGDLNCKEDKHGVIIDYGWSNTQKNTKVIKVLLDDKSIIYCNTGFLIPENKI